MGDYYNFIVGVDSEGNSNKDYKKPSDIDGLFTDIKTQKQHGSYTSFISNDDDTVYGTIRVILNNTMDVKKNGEYNVVNSDSHSFQKNMVKKILALYDVDVDYSDTTYTLHMKTGLKKRLVDHVSEQRVVNFYLPDEKRRIT